MKPRAPRRTKGRVLMMKPLWLYEADATAIREGRTEWVGLPATTACDVCGGRGYIPPLVRPNGVGGITAKWCDDCDSGRVPLVVESDRYLLAVLETGLIVATVDLEALLVVGVDSSNDMPDRHVWTYGTIALSAETRAHRTTRYAVDSWDHEDISDALPFGVWESGGTAIHITAVEENITLCQTCGKRWVGDDCACICADPADPAYESWTGGTLSAVAPSQPGIGPDIDLTEATA